VGLALIRWGGVGERRLDDGLEVIRFLFLAGPVSCATSATIGSLGFLLTGNLAPSAFVGNWLTFWSGDALGVVLIAPIAQTWPGKVDRIWVRRLLSVVVPMMLAAGITIGFFLYTRQAESRALRRLFERRAQAIAERVYNQVNAQQVALRALSSYYDSSEQVTQEEFASFVGSLMSEQTGVSALSWSAVLKGEDLAGYQARMRREYRPDFTIFELDERKARRLATQRPLHVVITSIHALERNETALGYDLYSEPTRRAAIDRARATGRASATSRLVLVQEPENQYGCLLLSPTKGQEEGIVSLVLRLGEAMEAALAGQDRSALLFGVLDDSAAPEDRLLYVDGESTREFTDRLAVPEGPETFSWSRTIPVADRKWQLVFYPTREFMVQSRSWQAWGVLTGGTLFTALLGAFLLIVSGHTQRIENLVTERTLKITEINRALEGEIAERRRAEAQAREAQADAERANEAKGRFLANMSHEIRTPMNAIMGFAELLTDTQLDKEQAEYAHTIQGSATALLGILNDILDFSKIEAGKLELVRERVVLRQLLSDVALLFAEPVEAKGLVLQISVDPAVPEVVLGDDVRMRQVISNLVSNAVKFTERGGLELAIRALSTHAPGRARLRFECTDTGPGILAGDRARIFRPFEQGDGSSTRRSSGTGLGLTISRQLIELMGGALDVTSEPGRGATFWFEVELEPASAAPLTTAPTDEATLDLFRAEMAGRRVLLVEDNAVNRMIAERFLQKLGLVSATAVHGAEALALFEVERFDVILMDCQMPVMDGYEATRHLRESGCRTTIIALTASAMESDREACLAAGMDDFLAKPVLVEDLSARLSKWFPPA
jgi:signal transduction histidine kinase